MQVVASPGSLKTTRFDQTRFDRSCLLVATLLDIRGRAVSNTSIPPGELRQAIPAYPLAQLFYPDCRSF